MHRRKFERVPALFRINGRSMARCGAVFVAVAGGAYGCGEDSAPVRIEAPAPELVREAYGLGGGSCYQYQAGNLSATVTVDGPNTTSIVGRTVYRWSFRLQAGGLPNDWFLDTESNGEVRLLRSVEGQTSQERTTRNYQDPGAAPLFYRVIRDFDGSALLVDSRFKTDVTPDCAGPGCPDPVPVEEHEWTVQSNPDPVSTPEGEATPVELLYRRTIDGQQDTAVYSLVPGRGFARIRTFDGTVYQVCNWRYCDGEGNCTGAASCDPADLRCN